MTTSILKGGMFSLFDPSSVAGEAVFTRFALGVESGVRRPHSSSSLTDEDDGEDSSDRTRRLPNTEPRVETGIMVSPARGGMVVDTSYGRDDGRGGKYKGKRTLNGGGGVYTNLKLR